MIYTEPTTSEHHYVLSTCYTYSKCYFSSAELCVSTDQHCHHWMQAMLFQFTDSFLKFQFSLVHIKNHFQFCRFW